MRPGDTIRATQNRLIESTTGTVILADEPGGKVLTVVTLHDLLRAQVSMSEREG